MVKLNLYIHCRLIPWSHLTIAILLIASDVSSPFFALTLYKYTPEPVCLYLLFVMSQLKILLPYFPFCPVDSKTTSPDTLKIFTAISASFESQKIISVCVSTGSG
jgi:hypothetical protein